MKGERERERERERESEWRDVAKEAFDHKLILLYP